jgi:hypothetical protein
MNAYSTVESAILELERLRRMLARGASKQVRAQEERDIIKATCLAWFNNHRSTVVSVIGDDLCSEVDGLFKVLLHAADRATLRSRHKAIIKALRAALVDLKQDTVSNGTLSARTGDAPPSFDRLVGDQDMKRILRARWTECSICVQAGAPLAAIVMMGGLLEALLLARILRESNKAKVLSASRAPVHSGTGKVKNLNEWTLRHYIDVSHELGWISSSAKDVGEVVRDYRNLVHPHKEQSHRIVVDVADATLVWEVVKSISRQLLSA